MNEDLKNLKKDIQEWLVAKEFVHDVRLFLDGKRYEWQQGEQQWDWVPDRATKYDTYLDDESLSMTFEGSLYTVVNDPSMRTIKKEFDALFSEHGYYYEQGHAWSLVAVED